MKRYACVATVVVLATLNLGCVERRFVITSEPPGALVYRNGVPLATSDWRELESHRDTYAALGVSLESAASRFDTRHYPFGSATAHVTGDLRTGENFHARDPALARVGLDRQVQGDCFENIEQLPLVLVNPLDLHIE